VSFTLAIIGILLLAFIGVPLFAVIGLAALTCFTFAGQEVMLAAIETYRLASISTLISIPLFTLAGYMMAESKSPQRIFRLAQAVFGHFPAGIAIVTIMVCAFFTAFTGASGVTIIALGGLLYPVLREQKFTDDFSVGLLTTCGALGLLFPPSLPLILYGVVAKVDVSLLFRAGIVPCLVLCAIYAVWGLIKADRQGGAVHKFSMNELKAAFRDCIWEALLPFFVIIGVYGGFASISEMATITVLYVAVIEFFIHKDLSFKKDFNRIVLESMYLVGGILMILSCAMGLNNYLVDAEIPMKILDMMKEVFTNRYSLLLFLNVFLLVIGAFKDVFSAIIVVVPLILPIAKEYGIHPVHLAIIFLTNLEIGYIAPPFGINLFIGSARFKRPIFGLYRATWPFLILSIIGLLIITYVPWLSLFLIP
jgi:tripartite ATP-independent transporter DctM subunit